MPSAYLIAGEVEAVFVAEFGVGAMVSVPVAERAPKFPAPAVSAAVVSDDVAVRAPAVSVPVVTFAAVIEDVAVMFPKIAEPMFAIAAKSEPMSDALVPVAFTNEKFWM